MNLVFKILGYFGNSEEYMEFVQLRAVGEAVAFLFYFLFFYWWSEL